MPYRLDLLTTCSVQGTEKGRFALPQRRPNFQPSGPPASSRAGVPIKTSERPARTRGRVPILPAVLSHRTRATNIATVNNSSSKEMQVKHKLVKMLARFDGISRPPRAVNPDMNGIRLTPRAERCTRSTTTGTARALATADAPWRGRPRYDAETPWSSEFRSSRTKTARINDVLACRRTASRDAHGRRGWRRLGGVACDPQRAAGAGESIGRRERLRLLSARTDGPTAAYEAPVIDRMSIDMLPHHSRDLAGLAVVLVCSLGLLSGLWATLRPEHAAALRTSLAGKRFNRTELAGCGDVRRSRPLA
jgi:hypothetical protein